MDFELDHMEMLSTNQNSTNRDLLESTLHSSLTSNESHILNDLNQQIEELQEKLKLSYRKLFLFETENQKLLKEKNFFFYEKNDAEEKLKAAQQRLSHLESYSREIEADLKNIEEKNKALEDLNKTQKIDLKRLTKFHEKITQIIKPHVAELKATIEKQNIEISRLQKSNLQYLELTEALNTNCENLKKDLTAQENKSEYEKKNLILSYEEQIHSLSKEILEFQQKMEYMSSEILRLKKANETKNTLENELIKFKRIASENLQLIEDLKLKKHQIEESHQLAQSELHSKTIQNQKIESDLKVQEQVLESTRQQLSRQIEENEQLHLKLKMLERLNIHLSQKEN